MGLTEAIGTFIADLSPNRIPQQALEMARLGFIDCIGTMIAGRNEDAVRVLTSVLAPADGPSSITFTRRHGPAPEAAWINGTAAHALDYDDVALRGHPSTVLVPAILAEAEALDASGLDMLVAYAAGYETWGELFRRNSGLMHKKGWHPTGLYGAVGAAAACAKLRRLDAGRAAMAVALGASQSAGLMANFGTMTKPFHAGRAAHAGIMSARLAEAGFTASADALEHPQGFLHAVSPDGTEDRVAPPRLGEDWALIPLAWASRNTPPVIARIGRSTARWISSRPIPSARMKCVTSPLASATISPPCCVITRRTLALPPSSASSSPWSAPSSPIASACANSPTISSVVPTSRRSCRRSA